MDIMNCIMGRRCVRAFKDRGIQEEILYSVLEAARWSPSSGNLQNTRLVVVTDRAKKEVIAKASLEQDFIAQAPVVVIVCSETDIIKRHYKDRGAKLYAIQNTAVAIQNIMLAAHNYGLATCWIGAFAETKLRKEFKIPDKVEIHAIIPIGYPNERPSIPPRIQLSDITYFKEWKKHEAAEPLWPLQQSAPRIARKTIKKAKEVAKKAKAKLKRK